MCVSNADLLEIYRLLVMGRKLELAIHESLRSTGHHQAVGEEAVVIGSFYNLRKDDVIAPHYRGAVLAAYLRGADLRKLFAGILGKETSYNRGRYRGDICMPMEFNVIGLWSGVLGTSLSLATGAALAAKLKKTDNVAVVSFGDGTSNLGIFHEAVNLAASLNLPVVFICQNNQYAISTRARDAMKCRSVADRALGYGIPGADVDGNDVLEVHAAVQEAVARARQGEGPSLIEALTYRVKGHQAIDPATYRPPEEVEEWKKKDPVSRLEKRLTQSGLLTEDAIKRTNRELDEKLATAIRQAEQDPEPGPQVIGLNDAFAPSL
jgi:TPP-dependent pyruvate/acetoin dehydrogenase alpha subunit